LKIICLIINWQIRRSTITYGSSSLVPVAQHIAYSVPSDYREQVKTPALKFMGFFFFFFFKKASLSGQDSTHGYR